MLNDYVSHVKKRERNRKKAFFLISSGFSELHTLKSFYRNLIASFLNIRAVLICFDEKRKLCELIIIK